MLSSSDPVHARRLLERRISEPAPRTTCYECFRPTPHCYCGLIQRIDNQTGFIIIQHPRERFHPIGTARIAQLSLRNVRVEVDHERRLALDPTALELPAGTGLLYPGSHATPLESLKPGEGPRFLVVLDGTWHHAHCMFRDIRALHDLPQYSLSPDAPSQYRLRREPRGDYISTVEAIARCLDVLEPETPNVDKMLNVFHTMIDRQLQARDTRADGPRPKKRRAPAARAFPRALAEEYADLVVVYGESATAGGEAPPQVIHWVAERVSTGERFEAVVRPRAEVNPERREHIGLSPLELSSAPPEEHFLEAWNVFLRDSDVVAAWTPGTLKLLTTSTGFRGRSVLLKGVYFNLGRERGSLENVLKAEGLHVRANSIRGRAGQRLAHAVAITAFLHALASL